MRLSRLTLVAIAGTIVLAAWFLLHRSDAGTRGTDHDVAVVPGGAAAQVAPPSDTAATVERVPPPAMRSALALPPGAVLRAPLPNDARSIVCGEVSTTGASGPYRRFVYNRAGDTGAIDDGTSLFDRFADRICRLR